jgi:lysophospholipase L1-like esterase
MTAEVLAAGSREYTPLYDADIVTLDIGANDLLSGFYSLVDAYPGIQESTDPAVIAAFQKEVAVVLNKTVANLGTTGKTVQANIETILQNVLKANPKAKIYVMGYYNPQPALKQMSGTDLTLPVVYFNTFIYRAISNVHLKNRGALISYIEMAVAMSDALDDGYLVPVDIHPTIAGHEMIAKLFWQRIKLDRLLSKLM